MKKITAKETLLSLQTYLWYDDRQKLFFSNRRTGNPGLEEYYWFSFNQLTGERKHGLYNVLETEVIVLMNTIPYSVRELVNMRRYGVLIIQFSNPDDPKDYFNYVGTEMPVVKGDPYLIQN